MSTIGAIGRPAPGWNSTIRGILASHADLRATFSIKGVTAPVPLPVRIILLDDGSVRLSAKTEVDRAQFGLDWNRLGMIGEAATASADVCFVRAPR
jgi:polyisoprenoid-binding protein YceI